MQGTILDDNDASHIRGGFRFCSKRDDGELEWVNWGAAYEHKKSDDLGAPGCIDMEGTSQELKGVGSGSTTVVVTNTQQPGQGSTINANGNGVDGVVSNVFAKEDLVKVDADPTLRKDLCCESYCCCFLCSGGTAGFFKLPDCLGFGSNCTSFIGQTACTTKLLQKPTLCEILGHTSCIDLSTCCSNRGENDKSCCTCQKLQFQCTYCCLCQQACKMECGLMRTMAECWQWCLCVDYRCAFPPAGFAPLQCGCCGFMYRGYGGKGCGFQLRGDDGASEAAPTNSTTVVVVQNN